MISPFLNERDKDAVKKHLAITIENWDWSKYEKIGHSTLNRQNGHSIEQIKGILKRIKRQKMQMLLLSKQLHS